MEMDKHMNRQSFLKLSDWILPPNVFQLLTRYRPSAVRFALTHRNVLRANKSLLNRHRGERCFILCNGPSVKQQDIRPLKNEIVFSVSNGYLHPDFGEIRPRYHCVPQITYAKMTPELTVRWFREMHARLLDAELFLDQQEWALVQQHGLFAGRQVKYICAGRNYFLKNPISIPALDGIVPRAQTVPIMAILIALYMGFKNIYLLGVDHDWFVKKEYRYFFEPGLLAGMDLGVRPDGKLETTLWDELPAVSKVWSQYRSVKLMAREAGATIYNATYGGMLDEFERIQIEDALSSGTKR